MSTTMSKGADTKYIDQRFDDHNSWIKSIENDHKETQKRVTVIETSHAGMAEAVRGLAEDMQEFKNAIKTMSNSMTYGFLGVISTGVIVGIIIYLTK